MQHLIHLNAESNFKKKGKKILIRSQVNSFSTLSLNPRSGSAVVVLEPKTNTPRGGACKFSVRARFDMKEKHHVKVFF